MPPTPSRKFPSRVPGRGRRRSEPEGRPRRGRDRMSPSRRRTNARCRHARPTPRRSPRAPRVPVTAPTAPTPGAPVPTTTGDSRRQEFLPPPGGGRKKRSRPHTQAGPLPDREWRGPGSRRPPRARLTPQPTLLGTHTPPLGLDLVIVTQKMEQSMNQEPTEFVVQRAMPLSRLPLCHG